MRESTPAPVRGAASRISDTTADAERGSLRQVSLSQATLRNLTIDHDCFSQALLDHIPQAILAVDAAGRVLALNAAAEATLSRRDALILKADHLTANRPRDASRLAACISEYARTRGTDCRSSKWLKIERRNALPYAIVITPLQCRPASACQADASGAALVLILDLERKMMVPPQALRELFALTPAEARLCSALLNGQAIDSAAEALHVSPNTARTQVRSIFSKLHLTRQQQLIRLLSTLTSLDPILPAES